MVGSLGFRVAIAVVLIVLFIALSVAAIGLLVALGAVIFGAMAGSGKVNLWVAVAGVGCFGAAALIAWSLLPRIDRFEPPGPELVEADHPALFAELRRVAAATREAMPRHVYVMWDVNAFVAQRGGVMGIGSKRVMGIGLPLLRILDVSELRGVLAHEMGHFYGGDTRLGPWIYKTRSAIGRTIMNLARAANTTAEIHAIPYYTFVVVLAPFRWFGAAFMRVTQAISRAQELSADRIAAGVESAAVMIDGLKKTHAGALAHELYLAQELAPIVDAGALPPVGAGFQRFLASSTVARLLDDVVEEELASGERDPFDSHPPLRERIEHLSRLSDAARERDPRGAITLLSDGDALEQRLVAELIGRQRIDPNLPAIGWDEVSRIWIARWREVARQVAPHLGELTIATVPRELRALHQLLVRVEDEHTANGIEDGQLQRWAAHVLGATLCCLLADAGFEASTAVGEPVSMRNGDRTVEPFTELRTYLRGETSPEAWVERWTTLGLADHRLAAL